MKPKPTQRTQRFAEENKPKTQVPKPNLGHPPRLSTSAEVAELVYSP